ncbi:hypothetical protein ACX80U_12055 [Arthrobacter sp. TmT3-37]
MPQTTAAKKTTELAKDAGAKTPEDKKKPRHKKHERFEWTSDDGHTLSAVYVENLPYGAVMQFQKLEPAEAQDSIIGLILNEEDRKLFNEELSVGEVMEFLDQWQEESSISLGEL